MLERIRSIDTAPLMSFNKEEQNPIWVQDLAFELKNHSQWTYEHSLRVSLIAKSIGQELNLTDQQIKILEIAGLLHDVGKIKVPLDVLNNTSQNLSQAQRELLDQHPRNSFLKTIGYDENVGKIVVAHHEVLQERQYPRSTDRSNFDPLSQFKIIVALSDKTDAGLSNRPYQKGENSDQVFDKLSKVCDPNLVRISINSYLNLPSAYIS